MSWLQFILLVVYFGAFLALIGTELSRISKLLTEIKDSLEKHKTV